MYLASRSSFFLSPPPTATPAWRLKPECAATNPVPEALSLFVFTDDGLCNRTFAYFGHFEYTDPDLRPGLKETLTHETVERRRFICNSDALSGRHQLHRLHQPVQDQTVQITWLSTLTKSSDTT